MTVLYRPALLACLLLILAAGPALAHKVNLFAYVEGGILYAEGYFPDGRPVVNGKVEVQTTGGELLESGTTDATGQFQTRLPRVEALVIKLRASMGHSSSFSLKRAEVEAGK